MRFRKLRIAFSVTCGIACVLLIVLWVRSYWWENRIMAGFCNRGFQASHVLGQLRLSSVNWPGSGFWPVISTRRTVETFRRDPVHAQDLPSRFGFDWKITKWGWRLCLPYWFVLFVTATSACAPWMRWRFSIRALLIAMTLVAVALGAIVWLAQR
jgi:hypothetical protein